MQNLFYPSVPMVKDTSTKPYRMKHRYVVMLLCVLLGAMALAGCGQKGALYLPEDAPSNTQFIFYDNNDDSDTSKMSSSDGQDGLDEAGIEVSNDPQDY